MKRVRKLILGLLTIGLIGTGFAQGANAEWKQTSNGWAYTENGVAKTGWLLDNGIYYYLNSNGVLDNSKTTTVMPSEIKAIYDIVSVYKDGIFKYSEIDCVGNVGCLSEAGLGGKTLYRFYTEDEAQNEISEYYYDASNGNIYKLNQGNLTFLATNVTIINNSKLSNPNWKLTSEGLTYYKDGIRQAGWISDNNKYYYLDTKGIMQIGWIHDDTAAIGCWYYLNNDGSREDSETTLHQPGDIIQAESRFTRQTNDMTIHYIKTINKNNKIYMYFESTRTSDKYYYEIETNKAYCIKDGITQEYGETIGDIKTLNAQYNYDQCKQLAISFFKNSHSYTNNEFTMSSDQKADTNGEYCFTFYSVSTGQQINNCYVSSLTGKVRN